MAICDDGNIKIEKEGEIRGAEREEVLLSSLLKRDGNLSEYYMGQPSCVITKLRNDCTAPYLSLLHNVWIAIFF